MNDSMRTSHDDSAASLGVAPSLARIRQLVAERSAPASPIWLTLLLVATAGGGVFLASVWATEPGPLPVRTHVAFGICLVIAASWAAFAIHGLRFRQTLLVNQRVVAASLGTGFSVLFGAFGTAVALVQGESQAALIVAATGITFAVVASVLLSQAVGQRRDLRALRAALSSRRSV